MPRIAGGGAHRRLVPDGCRGTVPRRSVTTSWTTAATGADRRRVGPTADMRAPAMKPGTAVSVKTVGRLQPEGFWVESPLDLR
jgi:hypothetical protein